MQSRKMPSKKSTYKQIEQTIEKECQKYIQELRKNPFIEKGTYSIKYPMTKKNKIPFWQIEFSPNKKYLKKGSKKFIYIPIDFDKKKKIWTFKIKNIKSKG